MAGLRPGLASSAFAFCWSFGLAWLPTGLFEELSLCEQRKKTKNKRMRIGRDKSPLFYLPRSEYMTSSPRFLNLKMRIKA